MPNVMDDRFSVSTLERSPIMIPRSFKYDGQTPRMKISKRFGYFPPCTLTDSQWEKNYASLWAAWAKDRKLDASTQALRLFDEESLDEDHVALMNKENFKKNNDIDDIEFDEIIYKTRRSLSLTLLNQNHFSMHKRRRRPSSASAISWEEVFNQDIFNTKSISRNVTKQTSNTYDFYGPLLNQEIEGYLKFSSNHYKNSQKHSGPLSDGRGPKTNCFNNEVVELESFPSKLSWLYLHGNENAMTQGMTNNQTNSNNENVLMIDVKPATANGTGDSMYDYEKDDIDFDESTINSSLDSATLSSRSSGKSSFDMEDLPEAEPGLRGGRGQPLRQAPPGF